MFQIYSVLCDPEKTSIEEFPETNRLTVVFKLPSGWVYVHFKASTIEVEEIESRNPRNKELMCHFIPAIQHFAGLQQIALAG